MQPTSTEVIREGWMHKMSHNKLVSNKFQKRFFVLTTDTLKYAKSPVAMEEECDPYPLSGVQWIRPLKIANQFADFEIQFPKKILRLKGLDTVDTQVWFEEIEAAIKKMQQVEHEKDSTSTSAKDASPTQGPEHAHETSQTSHTSNSTFQQQQQQHAGVDLAARPSDSISQYKQQQAAAAATVSSSEWSGLAATAHGAHPGAEVQQQMVQPQKAQQQKVQQEKREHADEVPRRPPSPPRVATRLPYRSLPKGEELDLSAGELPGREELEEDRPSPRSMLANPHRFGTYAASSPQRKQSPPQKVQQAIEHIESESEEEEEEEEPVHHLRNLPPGVTGPLSAESPCMSAASSVSAREGSARGVRASADGLHASRERPSSGVAERLSRTLPPRGSLRPRLLQPDAPLPEAIPKPGLHHTIGMQKQHSGGAEESERLELPDRPARSTTAAQPSGGTGSSRSSARSVARPSPAERDPESESLVLEKPMNGGMNGGPQAITERGSLNRSGGSNGGTQGNASLQSSMGSARAAAPRLLSGAAARAPPPQDERIELPPSRFPPKAPPAPPASTGRDQQQELEENWDSDEEGDKEEDQQARLQREEQERAKAQFLARQQQEQLEQERQERASSNWWDEDDENDGDTRSSKPKTAVPSRPNGKPVNQRPFAAAQRDIEHASTRDVPAHVQAGVTVDKNFAEENWDSDEE